MQGKPRAKDEAVYSILFPALAVGVATVGQIIIDRTSNFVLRKRMYFADIAGALQTDATRVVPLVNVNYTDGRRSLVDVVAGAPVDSIFNSGGKPFVLPEPRVFLAGTTLTVTVVSFAVAGTVYNLRLTFSGTAEFF